MTSHVHRWLAARSEGVPDALREAIAIAIQRADDGSDDLEAVLRAAAHDLLSRAVEGGEDDALALLTADALITYVCEAVSERDPRALARLS